ncbi:MAG: DUF433 domain-containing protein, partial [Dehalococcoidia bacterium]
MAIVDVGQHMVIDPEIMHGQMTFKGTRVPVDTVMVYLAKGESIEEIVRNWPQLSPEAVGEAVRLASESLHHRYQVELLAAQDEARRLRDAV